MGRLFGTDGMRGMPGEYPLVPELLRRLGYVAASLLRERLTEPSREGMCPSDDARKCRVQDPLGSGPRPGSVGKRPAGHAGPNGRVLEALMGRDPRDSGPSLGRFLAQGFARAGWLVRDVGVVPTPALAYLVPRRGALCGMMISASHNPAEFNGIKFFTGDGYKMGPELEDAIERRLDSSEPVLPPATRVIRDRSAEAEYVDFLRSTFPPHLDLRGMKVVLDCANGAAYRIAPRLLRSLGAELTVLGCRPDGSNVNAGCGALDTAAMRREVVRRGGRCGVSLDGDADRAVFADSEGRLCDGDVLLSMAAADLQEKGLLRGGGVVVTVMSNYGLLRFLGERGIAAVQVPVGDRNVTEAIEREDLSLGGESSGHVIFRRFGATGDGLLTTLQILAILAETGRPLSFYRRRCKSIPHVLKNVRVSAKVPLEELPRVRKRIRECELRLKGEGRVFVRYSGTEPVIRILVEGPRRGLLRRLSEDIAATFKREIESYAH